tara:strand:+ start:6630 stop:8348 length:1719 start_codon:yes stop_codon:yes gene_type:complete
MEKIENLKKILSKSDLDGYLIPKNDEFFNEYVSDDNDRLKYISNFSGSFGLALILRDKNYLFVDGRYTLQARNQSGKFFKIVTIPNKMPIDIFQNQNLVIGFDPMLFTNQTLNTFFNKCNCRLLPMKKNLIDMIWKRKIIKNKSVFYKLPDNSVGDNYKVKIKKIINNLKKRSADLQFISSSENNAWLFNIRGNDTMYTPIPYSYALIDQNSNIKFFCDLEKIPPSFKKYFKNIKFFQIDYIIKELSKIKKKKFIFDKNTCSIFYEKIILRNNKLLSHQDPIYNLKSIKKKKEIENIKLAHVYDGVALTKYLFWLEKNFNKKKITEISASQKLFYFRKKNDKFKFSSFPTISSTGPNGAIVHYKATKKTNRVLKKGDIYLVDSGGQYEFGTTDVTRTISLKNSNKRIRKIFTRVLKGHIAVSNYKLKKNTFGSIIDIEARRYLKQINLDYSHGTGHGVGYFLNVHEGPHAISKNNKIKLKEGMIMSNEPGYYEKNNFGIRIENLIYIKKEKNKLRFENLTMVPIDKNLIEKNMLSKNEKNWLNLYHKKVYSKLKNFMSERENMSLKNACSAI